MKERICEFDKKHPLGTDRWIYVRSEGAFLLMLLRSEVQVPFLLMLLRSEVQVPFRLMLLRSEVQVPFLLMLLHSEVENLLWVCD